MRILPALTSAIAVAATLACVSGAAFGEESEETTRPMIQRDYPTSPTVTDADNTRRNVRDRDEKTSTPFDQGSSESDVEMTRNIRKEVVASESFSNKAKNVKIITNNGRVVLRGPVDSNNEKQQVGNIAIKAAGAANVDNQLEVKGAE